MFHVKRVGKLSRADGFRGPVEEAARRRAV